MSDRPKVFVLMPSGDDFAKYYDRLLRPPLQAAGYTVSRAESADDQHNILGGIIRSIADADLVVADLTGLNANVFYEVGIAHALLRPTVLMTQSIDDLPFDLRSYRVIGYSTEFIEAGDFQEKLRRTAEGIRSGDVQCKGPVEDFLGCERRSTEAVTWPANAGLPVQQTPDQDDESTPSDDRGLLDFAMQVTSSMEKATTLLVGISGETQEMGRRINDRTADLELARNRPDTTQAAYRAAVLVGKHMTDYCNAVDAPLANLELEAEAYQEAASGLVGFMHAKSAEEEGTLATLRSCIGEALAATDSVLRSLEAYAQTVAGVRDQNISKAVTQATRKVQGTVVRLIGVTKVFESSFAKTLAVLDDNLGR
jgi:hypothetical protein